MRYLGTYRQYENDGEVFAIIRGLPGWPDDLIGGSTQEERAKKYMCIRYNAMTKSRAMRAFTDSLPDAETAFVAELATVGKTSRPFTFRGGNLQLGLNDWREVKEIL